MMIRVLQMVVCAVSLFLFAANGSPVFAGQTGGKAPEFSLTDLDGKTHRLSDYRGKVVLLNFWATWCPECTEELPSLSGLADAFRGGDLVILSIAADRSRESIDQLQKKKRISFPVCLDTTGGVFIRQYTVIGLPTTVIIDRNGNIAERLIGRTDFASADFGRKIRQLLDGGGKK